MHCTRKLQRKHDCFCFSGINSDSVKNQPAKQEFFTDWCDDPDRKNKPKVCPPNLFECPEFRSGIVNNDFGLYVNCNDNDENYTLIANNIHG
jgi:hypothetical protein